MAIEVGSRGKKKLRSLLSKLDRYKIRTFCTDYWKIYRSLIPENQLIQSKKQTTVVESINAVIIDLFSKKVVGMAYDKHMKTELIMKALISYKHKGHCCRACFAL